MQISLFYILWLYKQKQNKQSNLMLVAVGCNFNMGVKILSYFMTQHKNSEAYRSKIEKYFH